MPHVVDGGWCRYIFYLFNSIRNSLETGEWYCTVYHFKLQHSLYVLLLVKLLLFRIWKFSHVLTVPAAGGVTEKTFSVPLFFQLLEHLTGILADTSLCLEERTGFMLDDKLVISSKITLSLIWIQRWLCIIWGSKMLPDFFHDTETTDFFFFPRNSSKPTRTESLWKLSTNFVKNYSVKVFETYLWMNIFALGYYIPVFICRALERNMFIWHMVLSIATKHRGN